MIELKQAEKVEKAETVEEPKLDDIPEELIDEPLPEATEEKSEDAEFYCYHPS